MKTTYHTKEAKSIKDKGSITSDKASIKRPFTGSCKSNINCKVVILDANGKEKPAEN